MNKWLAFVILILSFLGCAAPGAPDGDIIPPAVISIDPQGQAVDPDCMVAVKFTEPVHGDVLESCLVVLLPDELVDDPFLYDFDKPPLTKGRQSQLIAGQLSSDMDGGRIWFIPEAPLEPGQGYTVIVSAAVRDRAGNPLVDELIFDQRGRVLGQQSHVTHSFIVRPALPKPPGVPVVFSEVLANPAGTESEGEYLELVNLGLEALDLVGWSLSDTGGLEPGDLLEPCLDGASLELAAGGVALLVGRNFQEPADMDNSALRICTARNTVTPRGLKNGGGEVLVLRAGDGQEVDRYGGWVNLSDHEGCAALRLDLLAPDGPENWAVPQSDPCRSPGWVE